MLLLVLLTVMVVVMILRHALLLTLLLLVVSVEEYSTTNADMVALLFENLDNGRAVTVLEDDLVTFRAELKAVCVCPLGEAVATLVPADGLDAHPREAADAWIVNETGLVIEGFGSSFVRASSNVRIESRQRTGSSWQQEKDLVP